jgi:hypothetical protein
MPFINKRNLIVKTCNPTIRVVKDPIAEYTIRQRDNQRFQGVYDKPSKDQEKHIHFDEITALKEELKEKDKKLKEFEIMVGLLFHDFTNHDDKLGAYLTEIEKNENLNIKELFSPNGEVFVQEPQSPDIDTPVFPTL